MRRRYLAGTKTGHKIPALFIRQYVKEEIEQRTANSEQRTANSELRTANSELRTANCELRTANWALVESYRSTRGAPQRVVAWLGRLDEAGRLGVRQAIDSTDTATGLQDKSTRGHDRQQLLFEEDENTTKPRWEEVNVADVRVENTRQFGGAWLTLHLIRMLQLDTFLQKAIPEGREQVPWDGDDESSAEPGAATTNVNGDAAVSEQDQAPETFILCRSRDRSKKEEAMTQRFETKIEEAVVLLKAGCEKKNRDIQNVERQICRLLAKNSRAAKRFDIKVSNSEKRSFDSPDLASERGSCAGSYLRVLHRLRAVEIVRATLHKSGPRHPPQPQSKLAVWRCKRGSPSYQKTRP